MFRVVYGVLVAYGSTRFLARGWVDALYLAPANHLSYRWFEWVQPLPAPLMHLNVATLAVLGVSIAAGFKHRLATGLFLVGFTYTELIDAALYLNHYWFITLSGVLLLLLPVHHHWSVDAAAGRVPAHTHVAAGVVWALRAQVAVVYCFAGLAKLNGDWLLRAQPMRLWLADRTHLPIVGEVLDEPAVAYLASWFGAMFDCSVVALLLWRKTRPCAYAALVAFHLATGALFQIGIFPWVMIASALIFFEPAWPRRLGCSRPGKLYQHSIAQQPKAQQPTEQRSSAQHSSAQHSIATKPASSPLVLAALAALALIQLTLPLRHYAVEGNVRWTEEGYYLAWRVMLTEKSGHVDFRVIDPGTGKEWTVDPALVLTGWQAGHAATRPDLIHATAHLIADHYRRHGTRGVEVRADAWVSMNGHPAHRIVDPTIDLAAHRRGNMPPTWILEAP